MTDDWYKHKNQPNSRKNYTECSRCKLPFKRPQPAGTQWIQGQEITKRPLCVMCDKRDREMLIPVMDCLRLFGGQITFHEILNMYSDEKMASHMHFDPFSKVRPYYVGKDILSIEDLEAWIEEGVLEKQKDGKMSVKASKVRQEIDRQHAERQAKEEKTNQHREIIERQQQLREMQEQALNRKRETGGASTGKHRWKAMHGK